MRIYIAGPMSNIPGLNFPAFHALAAELRAAGHDVVNPAEINVDADKLVASGNVTGEQISAHWQLCMRADITQLVTCDAIIMLPGWLKSRGASLEHHIARILGLLVADTHGGIARALEQRAEREAMRADLSTLDSVQVAESGVLISDQVAQ